MTKRKIIPALAALACVSVSLHAAEFGFQLGDSARITWEQDGIWQSRDGTPYPSGTFPGPDDVVFALDYDEGQGEGIPNFYLDGDRTIRRLEGSPRSHTRIISGPLQRGTIGMQSRLTIAEAFHVKAGTYYLFSNRDGELSIETPELILGSEDNATDRARIQIGAEGQGSVQLTTQKTLLSGFNPRISFSAGFDAVRGAVNLGHVTFDMDPNGVDNWSVAGIEFDTSGATLRVASLHGGDNEERGRIEGEGILLINPAFSSLPLEKVANFNRPINGGVALRKEGDSLQILSGSNAYTGGTEIAEGILSLRNDAGSGLGAGSVTVESHGILAGSGIIALDEKKVLTVNGGGQIAPGADNQQLAAAQIEPQVYQTLKIDNTSVKMQDDAVFTFRVGADGSSDRVAFTNYTPNALELSPGGVIVNFEGAPTVGQTYTLFTFASGNQPIASGIKEGLKVGAGLEGVQATFHYDQPSHGGEGTISVTLSPAP